MKDKEIVHILIVPSSCGKLQGGALKEMDHCARRAATEQLKFSWIHKVNFSWIYKNVFFVDV